MIDAALAADVLILGAFEPELAPLTRACGGATAATVGGVTVAWRLVGVGLPAAAAGAARVLGVARVRAVIMVGTCGAYPGAPVDVGDVAVSRRNRLADAAALAGQASFPEPMAQAIDADPSLVAGLAAFGARPLEFATTLAITVDDDAARLLTARTACAIEHLEAFGGAVASAAGSVPFAAVLGVANRVGAQGREQWRAHHASASASAVDCVLRWLRAGAPGLLAVTP